MKNDNILCIIPVIFIIIIISLFIININKKINNSSKITLIHNGDKLTIINIEDKYKYVDYDIYSDDTDYKVTFNYKKGE